MTGGRSVRAVRDRRASGRPGARALALAWTRTSACALALASAVALAGCGAGRTMDSPLDDTGSGSDEIEILVRNDNFSQVTVYTSRSGAYRRLGIVPGKGESTFRTEWYLPHIQLRVRFLAGPDFFTETLPVSPGELLELIIPAR